MVFETFWATVGAVIAANTLTLLYVWALWAGVKADKAGQPWPWKVILCGALGPIIGGVSIFGTVNW
jgi:hypothetical protein